MSRGLGFVHHPAATRYPAGRSSLKARMLQGPATFGEQRNQAARSTRIRPAVSRRRRRGHRSAGTKPARSRRLVIRRVAHLQLHPYARPATPIRDQLVRRRRKAQKRRSARSSDPDSAIASQPPRWTTYRPTSVRSAFPNVCTAKPSAAGRLRDRLGLEHGGTAGTHPGQIRATLAAEGSDHGLPRRRLASADTRVRRCRSRWRPCPRHRHRAGTTTAYDTDAGRPGLRLERRDLGR
jgi:hypothetical protein